MGSGNSCKNDWEIAKKMIDTVADLAPDLNRIILKWQLFEKAGDNLPLDQQVFNFAYSYALRKGFLTTSSVFDTESLEFLLKYPVPFIKLDCRPLWKWDGFLERIPKISNWR